LASASSSPPDRKLIPLASAITKAPLSPKVEVSPPQQDHVQAAAGPKRKARSKSQENILEGVDLSKKPTSSPQIAATLLANTSPSTQPAPGASGGKERTGSTITDLVRRFIPGPLKRIPLQGSKSKHVASATLPIPEQSPQQHVSPRLSSSLSSAPGSLFSGYLVICCCDVDLASHILSSDITAAVRGQCH